MTVLGKIITGVREDLAVRQAGQPFRKLLGLVREMQPVRPVVPTLRAPGLAVIAEVKHRSPPKGDLAEITDPAALATDYVVGGAAAIPVLTEKRRFNNSLTDFGVVRKAVRVSLFRRDFMVHSYQFYEARAHGADLVPLIAAVPSDMELRALLDLTDALSMTALVETHTEEEVKQVVNTGVEVIGINNRDLKTPEVDLGRFGKLVSLIPNDRVKAAESGILSIDDARRVRQEGANAILVGEVLVRHGDPRVAVEEFALIDRSRRPTGLRSPADRETARNE